MNDEKTIPEIITNRIKRYGGKILLQHKVGWSWKQITWLDFEKTIKDIACFLMSLGFAPGTAAIIVSGSRTESLFVEFAIYLLGGITIPIDDNDDLEKIIRIARDSKSRFMFVAKESTLKELSNNIHEVPSLHKIVTFTDMSIGEDERVIPFKGLLKFGSMKRKMLEDELARKAEGVLPGSTAAVFYNFYSDLKKERKEITHEDLIKALKAGSEKLLFITEEDQALSHLPYVSPYERFVNYLGIYMGNRISIAETTEDFFDDILEVKPTVLFETKRGLENIWSKALSNLGKVSPTQKLKSALGGRVKYILTDSLPRGEIKNLFLKSGVSLIEVPELVRL
ncbi:MAG: AMP-binding protein [Thermodesulfobacteriota bacterium]